MVKEAYVSFEVAKLLKEKGFKCEKKSISTMCNELGVFHLSAANYEDGVEAALKYYLQNLI